MASGAAIIVLKKFTSTKQNVKMLNMLLLALLTATTTFAADNWQEKLQIRLPLIGHRNWIVVTEAAYPLQTAPGISAYREGFADVSFLSEYSTGVVEYANPAVLLTVRLEAFSLN